MPKNSQEESTTANCKSFHCVCNTNNKTPDGKSILDMVDLAKPKIGLNLVSNLLLFKTLYLMEIKDKYIKFNRNPKL